MVLSADCKGIVMRPGALRAATAKAAARLGKMRTRLSAGEKPNRKRMACLVTVYDAGPAERQPHDVIAAAFDEAGARDPGHRRTWVVLVDGAEHQLDLIRAEAARRNADIHVVIDLIHVLEYMWKAALPRHQTGPIRTRSLNRYLTSKELHPNEKAPGCPLPPVPSARRRYRR